MGYKNILVGHTKKITWINSGVTPSPITAYLETGSGTLVNSVSMTSSGNGHYYANITMPNTPGFYVAGTDATINGKPYKKRERIRTVLGDS